MRVKKKREMEWRKKRMYIRDNMRTGSETCSSSVVNCFLLERQRQHQ